MRVTEAAVCVGGLAFVLAACSAAPPIAEQIATLPEQEMVVGTPTYSAITASGLDVLPAIFARLERTTQPAARFFLQLCAKQVVRRDYLRQHPEAGHVAWIEQDHSAQLLAWWAAQAPAECSAGRYQLPEVMFAIPGDWPVSNTPPEPTPEVLRQLGYLGWLEEKPGG